MPGVTAGGLTHFNFTRHIDRTTQRRRSTIKDRDGSKVQRSCVLVTQKLLRLAETDNKEFAMAASHQRSGLPVNYW